MNDAVEIVPLAIHRDLEAVAAQRIEDIAKGLAVVVRASARTATLECAQSVTLITPLLGGELSECAESTLFPFRVAELGELVRVYLNFANPDGDTARQSYLAHLLRREIEPFIIGVGQVEVRLTTEGAMVRRAELGVIDDSAHEVRS